MARYYNSWIENTDQVAEEEDASTVSAEASSHPAAISDHVPAAASRQSLPPADTELSTTSHSVDNDDEDSGDDDDNDDEDDNDVFRSFM